jgi:flagellar basal-body rod modification protein FlgD
MTDAITGFSPISDYLAPQATNSRAEQFGKDTFLKLLVAQLRYQDPTSPTEGAEFLAQTAQFTVVEKLEELAKTNSNLLAASMDTTAASMVGRTITYKNSAGTEATGVVTAARFGPTGPVLQVGNEDVPLGSVATIQAAPTTPTSQA